MALSLVLLYHTCLANREEKSRTRIPRHVLREQQMLIPSLKRNTNAVVPWQWHACYMFACEYNRNAPLDVMPDNELSHPLIFTQCGGFWVCACVCAGGGGGREGGCVIGETLLCFAVERSQQCLKGKASSGKKKQKERLQASLMLTSLLRSRY